MQSILNFTTKSVKKPIVSAMPTVDVSPNPNLGPPPVSPASVRQTDIPATDVGREVIETNKIFENNIG